MSKYWSKLNKEKKLHDLFFTLQTTNDGEPTYKTRSNKMAELARNYHKMLQDDGIEVGEMDVNCNR